MPMTNQTYESGVQPLLLWTHDSSGTMHAADIYHSVLKRHSWDKVKWKWHKPEK